MKAIFPLVLVCMLVGCSDAPSAVITPIMSRAPFNSIAGVGLNTRVDELLEQRPAVAFAPYVGYDEVIDGKLVSYHAGDLMGERHKPKGRDRIRHIAAIDTLAAGEDAERRFAEELQALNMENPACFRISRGVLLTLGAIASTPDATDFLFVHVEMDRTTSEVRRATADYGTALENPLDKAWGAGRVPIPCPVS